MSQAEDQVGLIQDLAQLARRGSGDKVLAACATLTRLKPVALAVTGGALGSVAARVLLRKVATEAGDGQVFVRAAAALTGIDPPDTGRGVRGDEGPLPRQRTAGEILEGRRARTMRQAHQRQRCYEEYASAVLDFVRVASRDRHLMEAFLIECGLDEDDAGRLARPQVPVSATAAPRQRSDTVPPIAAGDTDRSHAWRARFLPLAGAVREALDAARASCAAKNRAFYTPDLLLALLDMPNSQILSCIEEIEAGLGHRLRIVLVRSTSTTVLTVRRPDPFQPFEWVERQDIRDAQDLAAAADSPVVTDIHLLLAVLNGKSTTRTHLATLLGSNFARLRAAADARRRTNESQIRTPGLMAWLDSDDHCADENPR